MTEARSVVKSWTVGSSPDADITVADEYVSPRHARLYQHETGQAWVEDLGSTNGTWVNGQRCYGATRIYPGDTLRIGRQDLPWRI